MRFACVASLSLWLGGITALGATAPASAQTIEALNRVGFDAELAEEYDLAEDMWRQIAEIDPGNANSFVYLGNALLAQEKWADAEASFREGIQLLPDSQPTEPEALYLGLGASLRAQGQFQAAKAALETAVKTNDQVPFGHRALGRLLRDYGELEAAAEAFEAIIQLEPMAPHGSEAFWDLGKVKASQGDLDAAEREYRRAIALEPDRIEFLQSLASLLLQQGRISEMSQLAGEISGLKAENMDLATELKLQPLKQKFGTEQYRTQLAEAEAVIEQYPETVDAYIKLGSAQLKLGRFVDADAALSYATTLNPDNPLAHHLRSLVLVDLGDEAAVQQAYQTAQRLYPEIAPQGTFLATSAPLAAPLSVYVGYVPPVPPPRETLARPASALPDFSPRSLTAIPRSLSLLTPTAVPRRFSISNQPATLEEQIALNPDDGAVQMALASRLRWENKLAESAAAFQTAARLDPSLGYLANHNLGIVLFLQEKTDEAIAAFETAIDNVQADGLADIPEESALELANNVAETYLLLGSLLSRENRWTEALSTYREASSSSLIMRSERIAWERYLRDSLFSVARTSVAEGQYESAEAAYQEAIRDYPGDQLALLDELGSLQFAQGKLQAAEATYTAALRDYPAQGHWVHRGLEAVLRAQNRNSEADVLVAAYRPPVSPSLSSPIAIPPLPPLAIPSPSTARISSPAITRPTILPPGLPSRFSTPSLRSPSPFLDAIYQTSHTPLSAAYNNFGQMRFAQGRYNHAKFAFSSSLSESPHNLEATVNNALALLYQGERDDAASLFSQAVDSIPEEISCYVFPDDAPAPAWQPVDYFQTGEACLSVLID